MNDIKDITHCAIEIISKVLQNQRFDSSGHLLAILSSYLDLQNSVC